MNRYQPSGQDLEPTPQARAILLTSRIIVGSFGIGIAIFLIVSIMNGPTLHLPSGLVSGGIDTVMIPLSAVMLLSTPGIGLVLRSALLRPLRTRAQSDDPPSEEDILVRFQSWTVIRSALIEAPGLLAICACFLTGNVIGLAIGAVAILFLLFNIPTRGRLNAFTRDALGTL